LTPEDLEFSTAEALFGALRNPSAIDRRAILAWVATHPAESIALGTHEGRDVVDVLMSLIDPTQEYRYWQDVAIAIGAFDSPKVTEFYCGMLAEADETLAAMDATSALARRDLGAQRERLIEILLADDQPDRATGAAELLASVPDLPERAAVRVSALEEDGVAPALTPTAVDAWVDELGGPFGAQARGRLQQLGPDAARALAERWERLDEEDRGWLLRWATEEIGSEAAPLVAIALEGPDDLARVALDCAAALPGGAVDSELLSRWIEHPDPGMRAAAIAAGAEADLESLLTEASEPEVVVAAIERLAAGGDTDRLAAPLAAQLASDSTEVRAAARGALVALGPGAIDELRPLARSSSPAVRAAAVSALLDLGDDEWLAAELLDRPAD
jgi:hypothetical protein